MEKNKEISKGIKNLLKATKLQRKILLNKIVSKSKVKKILLYKGTLSNKKVQNKKIVLLVIFTSLLLAYFFRILEPIAPSLFETV